MVTPESVSPFFAQLYETKVKMLRANLSRLDLLLSRHNFYDCQTVLQLKHPQTNRKVVLLQAEMDVDADGSDSDRMPIGSGAPTNFKPIDEFSLAKENESTKSVSGVDGRTSISYRKRIGNKDDNTAAQKRVARRACAIAQRDRHVEEVQLPHWRD